MSEPLGIDSATWQAIETLAVLIGLVGALVAVAIGLTEMKEQTKARSLQALMSVIDQLNQTASAEDRQWIEQEQYSDPSQFGLEERARANRIIYGFNRIGLLVEEGFISPEPVIKLVGQGAVNNWKKLERYIYLRRSEPGSERLGIHFERFCRRSVEWMRGSEYEEEVREAASGRPTPHVSDRRRPSADDPSE